MGFGTESESGGGTFGEIKMKSSEYMVEEYYIYHDLS